MRLGVLSFLWSLTGFVILVCAVFFDTSIPHAEAFELTTLCTIISILYMILRRLDKKK